MIAAIMLARPDQDTALAAFVAGIVGQVAVDQIVLRAGRQSDESAGSAVQALAGIPQSHQSTTHIDLASVNRAASTAAIAAHVGFYVLMFSLAVRIGPAGLIVGPNPDELWSWIVAPAIAGFATLTLFAPARLSLPAFSAAKGMTGAHASRMRAAIQAPKSAAPSSPLPEDAAAFEQFAPEERAEVMRWLESMRMARLAPFRPWLAPRNYVFISYAWAGEIKTQIADRVAGACASVGIEVFLDKQGVESPSGAFRVFLGRGLARATHVLVVITPETLQGTVVLTEIETAMQRWPLEWSPALICVVEPDVAEALQADREVPLRLRILLNFCPQLSVAEAADPAIVRYMLEWTRRPGRIGDWLFLLSPATALARAVSLDGVAAAESVSKPN